MTYALALSETEIQTRRLFNAAEWSPTVAVIGQVFVAHSDLSLTLEDIGRMCSTPQTPESLKPTATKLVGLGVLRSRVIRGVRHYEVNY